MWVPPRQRPLPKQASCHPRCTNERPFSHIHRQKCRTRSARASQRRAAALWYAAAVPAHPDHIGPYRVLRPIAAGGMAEVYEVQDPSSGERFALKLLIAVKKA